MGDPRATKGDLQHAYAQIVDALADLEPLFRFHRVTFVARCLKDDIDADMIVTAEDADGLRAAADVLRDHAGREGT